MFNPHESKDRRKWNKEPPMEREIPSFQFFHPVNFSEKIFKDIETKEDAIDFLKYRIKKIDKYKKRLTKKIKQLELKKNILTEKINVITNMDNPSPEEMRKAIKKAYREYALRSLDEDD